MHRLLLVVTLLAFLPGCDLLLGVPPPPLDGGDRDRDRDECDNDDDCDGGEECDDGDCVDIDVGEGEGEGEGEPPPPPPPVCGDAACPQILSLSSNVSTIGQFDSATLSAVVTDPDGVADIIGGVLIDPVSDATYATFTATGSGTFTINVSWSFLNPVRPIDFDGSVTRVVRARFFDQAGHEAFDDVSLTLQCTDDVVACDGRCGEDRCGGQCLSAEELGSNENCGSCGNQCDEGAFCNSEIGAPFCECPGGNCGPPPDPVPGTRYTGAAEAGVVCGEQTCARDVACCLGLDQSVSCDDGSGACFFPIATCDGPEDCSGTQECCLSGFSSACVSTGQCRTDGNREVCVDDDDCLGTEICCTDDRASGVGLDGGVCAIPEAGQCPDLAAPAP
ncbi:MAG: hypothetical protein Q8O67_00035 [Deltaproteobacteria bacterium]|nr:hypothetical protein [Deltaproteobacteria bacterium]